MVPGNAVRRANDPKRRKNNSGHTGSGKDLWRSCRDAPKIAAIAQVPLGSMTYYFAGMDALLSEAFTLSHHREHRVNTVIFWRCDGCGGGVPCDNGNDLLLQVTTPDNRRYVSVICLCQRCFFSVKTVMQNWMQRARIRWRSGLTHRPPAARWMRLSRG